MFEVYFLLFLFRFIQAHFETKHHFCGLNAGIPIIDMYANGKDPPLPDPNVPFTPFRIYFDYAHLDSQVNTSSIAYINAIKNLLEQAKDVFQKVITFQQKYRFIALGNFTCNNLTTSPIVKSPGVPADIVILPYLVPTLSEGVLAAAGPCYLNPHPMIGVIKINSSLQINLPNSNDNYVGVFMHEMTHIFVFIPGLFERFRDSAGALYKNPTIHKVVNGVNKTLLATPKVIEAAKKHFGCDRIDGIELEDYGGPETAGAHWDGRVMLGDYMIGASYEEMFFSDITMALFEDSGWYKMNYYTGGQFKFGRGEGCSFLNQKCIVNKTSTNPKYFGTSMDLMCLQGRATKGFTYVVDYPSDLPKEHQYFDNPKSGGSRYADFCPVAFPFISKEKHSVSNCKTGNLQHERFGEVLSETSNCFISSLVSSSADYRIKNIPICYPFRCDFYRNTTLITVLRNEIECPTEGGNKTFSGFKGSIQCPRFDEICTTQTPCLGLMDCVEKKSLTYYHTPHKEVVIQASYTSFNAALLILIIALL